MKKVTMADVAKEAGVSKSTVSQYLNKRYEYMGKETKNKIKQAIDKLNYQPNYIARSLKQKRTAMIGIIVANMLHRFSTEIVHAIEKFFHTHELHAIICNANDNSEKEKRYIEMLRAKQVDGLIIFPTGKNNELYKRLVNENYPIVFVDRKVEGLEAFSVVTDNMNATYKAIKKLINQGHKQIIFAVQPLTVTTRMERLDGYKKAFIDSGLKVNPELIIESTLPEMKEKMIKLLSLENRPTAIFAGNDRVFNEVTAALEEMSIKVGRDIELIVFDNIPFAHLLGSISFIVQPTFDMGRKAAELLYKQINKENEKPKEFIFPSKLETYE